MNTYAVALVTILSTVAIILLAMTRTVTTATGLMNALCGFIDAFEIFVIRLRRLMKTLGRRTRRR